MRRRWRRSLPHHLLLLLGVPLFHLLRLLLVLLLHLLHLRLVCFLLRGLLVFRLLLLGELLVLLVLLGGKFLLLLCVLLIGLGIAGVGWRGLRMRLQVLGVRWSCRSYISRLGSRRCATVGRRVIRSACLLSSDNTVTFE